MADLGIIRPKELAELLGVDRTTLYRWHNEGNMPIEKIKIGPRAAGYRRKDVEAWLNGELEEKDKGAAEAVEQ